MYLTHLEKEYREAHSISTLKNGSLGLQNSVVPFRRKGITFLSTLNVMIMQTVRNECVRFGGHVDIEVGYKILQLEVLYKAPILHNSPCFQ
jgi:hypothetical protein